MTCGSAGRVQLVKLRLLSTHHPWISWQSTAGHTAVTLHPSVGQWQSTAGHTSVTLHSSPVDQLAEYLWSHFGYSPLITRGSAGMIQLVTLLLLSTHDLWISWQSAAGQTSVTLHSSSVGQLAEHSWSHFGYSSLTTRGSAGKAQLVTLLPLSTHHPYISWQSTAGHTSVTLHSSPVDQLAKHRWSHFCYSPLITSGSAGRAQLVTLLLLSTHHPWISWQSTTRHTSVTLHLSPVDQLEEHSWSHLCYSPLITSGSAVRVQLVTLLLFSNHHPWIGWQSTAGHTAVTLHS